MGVGDEVIRAVDVRHVYPDGTALDYRGLPFIVRQGERVAMLGPNGSGKTTFLFHLLGLLRPTEGSIQIFGVDPVDEFEKVRWRIGVVLQNPDEQIIAPTVAEDIAFSPRNYGMAKEEVERRVAEVAREFEIDHLLRKVPHYLSGGERRKVALAGALVLGPELLILDEPFEGLDTVAKAELLRLLRRLHAERNIAIITTTHEINLVPEFVDTVYLLAHGGTIVLKGTPREIFEQPAVLAEHHLEPPTLVALFQRLRERGIPVDLPLSTDEAVHILVSLLRSKQIL